MTNKRTLPVDSKLLANSIAVDHILLTKIGDMPAIYENSYKNPLLLAYMYYTEGLSTIEIANMLGCEQRTIRRYMNKHGLRRFTKDFSLLVMYHGIEGALKIQDPTFYDITKK
ncbi:transcriptional regulator [Bacillus phage Glittering]|uniref:Transcriptional repressor n=1 Tax=Bacillus phage Glittering TaxID=2884421 RepID=U5PXA8_9CAUD|nr:transcriptional regulator [Bacillus phage Glittering]AGY47227.1 transcriptional repressor [Bacillus phage Glittering]